MNHSHVHESLNCSTNIQPHTLQHVKILCFSSFGHHFCLVLAIPSSMMDITFLFAFASSRLFLPLVEDSLHAGHVENQRLGIVVVVYFVGVEQGGSEESQYKLSLHHSCAAIC